MRKNQVTSGEMSLELNQWLLMTNLALESLCAPKPVRRTCTNNHNAHTSTVTSFDLIGTQCDLQLVMLMNRCSCGSLSLLRCSNVTVDSSKASLVILSPFAFKRTDSANY